MATSRILPSATLALLIAVGGMAEPAWGNKATELRLAQADQGEAGLDEAAAKKLFEQAQNLLEAEDLKGAAELYERGLAWSEKTNGREHQDTGEILFILGSIYAAAGEYSKSEPLYQRALANKEKALGPEHPDTAAILNNLALLYKNQDLYAKAEPLFQRALAISEKALGPEHENTVTTLINLAELYRAERLYAKAEPLHQRALAFNERVEGPEHPDTVQSLNKLALVYQGQGLYAKAEPLFRRTLAINEKVLGPEHPETATSLNNLATLYDSQRLYAKAEPLLNRYLAIIESLSESTDADIATSLLELGSFYHRYNYYDKAESFYQRAILLLESALTPQHYQTIKSLRLLANLYKDQGLYAKAEPLLQRIVIARGSPGWALEFQDLADSLNDFAELYYEMGMYAKAAPLIQKALSISEESYGREHPRTSRSLSILASLYRAQGLYAKAESLYQRALAISEKAEGAPNNTILGSLALLYSDQGLYHKAIPLFERVLLAEAKTMGPEDPRSAASLLNLAVAYNDQGLFTKAAPLAVRALTISENSVGPVHINSIKSLRYLGLIYENMGRYDENIIISRRVAKAEYTLIQREAPYLPVAERQSFLNSFGDAYLFAFSSAKRGSSGANLALSSRLNRQGLLQEIEQRQAALASLPGPQQALASELRAVTQQLASIALPPEQRQQLKGRQEDLEKQLYRLLPQLQPRVVEVQQVAAALPAGSALIEFQRYQPYDGTKPRGQLWGAARYLALVLKPDGAITPIDLGLAKPIDALIQSALEASEQKQADALEIWAHVGRAVLNPLSAATREVNTLFISPDGELNRIPFAALPAPGSSQLLSEALKLRMLTTGRELLDLQNAPSTNTSPALVVANPAFDRMPVSVQSPRLAVSSQQRSGDLASQRWAPLPGTATEGAAIAQLTGGRLLAGEQARAATIQQQQAPRLLHLATHAYFQPDLPEAERKADQPQRSNTQRPAALGGENPLLRSGIVFAGANQPDADPADDGYLTALEVARLNWKGTDLVVISACESGKGEIQAGEGVYGLKRAIAVAGARSSLLSLWKVDDRATAAFMESFYNKLKAGTGRADALASTQQEFRQSSNATWNHPYVWAAFQLSGDWGAVKW